MNRSHKKKKSRSSRSRSQSLASDFLEDVSEDLLDLQFKYEVKVSDIMGRYIVSSKNIQPGEIIIMEEPLVVGPCSGCKVQCLGCYKSLENEDLMCRCKYCGWPMCSEENCSGLGKQHGHTKIECTILQECKSASTLNYSDIEDLRISFNAIVPLRCLILKTTDPSSYALLMDMESHNKIRRSIKDLWSSNQYRVVDRIVKKWGLTEFTEDEIHTICGILEVNAFEIGQQNVTLRAVYPTAFLLSHDCIPNTNHIDQEGSYRLTIRASTLITRGQAITLSYAYTLQNTQKRRHHLLDNKFFECQCKRCCDPTELGTHLGSFLCPKCTSGIVLSDNPLDFKTTWSCSNSRKNCPGYTMSAKSAKLLIDRVSQEAEAIDTNDIEAMESFLHKYRNVLHPNHHIFLLLKISLTQLYGRISRYLIHELSEKELNRKMDLCKDIFRILDIVEPGYTRIRGVTFYELHAPMMILLNRQVESKSLSKYQVKSTLREVMSYLTEAETILNYEPEHSAEGIMGRAATDAIVQIKDWEKIVGKLK